ncbi:ComEA family DNA-binding protein [Curtobacterium flaccumfaciens]|nr:ComEA family DNA-binding protein [Curtobacterium flaccumfaciens]
MSPRASVLLAAVVVVVAVVVVLLGPRSGGSGGGVGGVSVTAAPSVVAPSAVSSGGSSSADPSSAVASPAGGGSSSGVIVHVAGAVGRPGVVTLATGARVSDAIERAGGAGDDADLARLNLARVLEDGERLYVPKVGETDIPAALGDVTVGAPARSGDHTDGATDATGAVIDLNSADQAALETLPGIGPGLAGRILAWRDEHGRFSAVEDLLDVSGIGDGRFADLRDRVTV